jgi:hypothetical protein
LAAYTGNSVEIVGNTTTPAAAQLHSVPHDTLIDLFSTLYHECRYPATPCPLPLYIDVIVVNNLRYKAATGQLDDLSFTMASNILTRINSFSPERWAETHETYQSEWLLISRIYHSAVAVFCISTLQDHSLLESNREINATRNGHIDSLFQLIEDAEDMQRVKWNLLWPVVVAGFAAFRHGADARNGIVEKLTRMHVELQAVLPLLAKSVLQKFWASEGTTWESCFDEPYAFVL